ncbi:UDP-N-acetylmuramate dehydrogenase [Prochlorococcus sp. MIT 1307]|uniref:UDP-N-acetylmuramate dehydrogenase n=1 Tax=Prochlorococcus sp. MIT 1307 TaxID=3096219 RepID=UPI002A75C8C3|nr:UDP-N-acetylmuramate dehydrogenase [Prochlorococcus sp. MIT 1307]
MAGLNSCGLSPLQGLKLTTLRPLSQFTTLRVGGAAEWLAEPKNIEEVKILISWAKTSKIPCQVIGAGSNLLINDSGLPGLSICMKKMHGSNLNAKSGLIEAFSGEPFPALARNSAKAGLQGLEWAVGIPGTVGGAVVMNAGAQGGCTGDLLESVTVLPLKGGEVFEIKKKDLQFSYRHSLLQKEKLVVLAARFHLEPGHDQRELSRRTNANLNHRTKTQPYDIPSCGSVFRNPEPLKAGKLIENLGLKGHRIGGAEISKLHANFIVNRGEATAQDISQLISYIQKTVQEAHGFLLHPEVKQLGFDKNT